LRVVVWQIKFLLGRLQRATVDGEISEEVRVMSGVLQLSVLRPLLFLVCVDDIWRNTESNVRVFAVDFLIYKKIMASSDINMLQTYLNRLEERTTEMK
jgi:hypothetical protein